MTTADPSQPALSAPLRIVISAVLLFHLVAVVGNALATTSGPWPTPEGANVATPPQFAYDLTEGTNAYLRGLKLTHTYHYPTNQVDLPAVRVEARVFDAAGAKLLTVALPDPTANPWLRHRQELLAKLLAGDMPVPPPVTEAIPAPNVPVPTMIIWDPAADGSFKLKQIPVHEVPRNRPVYRPSDSAQLVASSFQRYLGRMNGAATVEVVRHSRDAVPPAALFQSPLPPGLFDELVSNFGGASK